MSDWLRDRALWTAGLSLAALVAVVVWLWERHFDLHDAKDAQLTDHDRRITVIETRLDYPPHVLEEVRE